MKTQFQKILVVFILLSTPFLAQGQENQELPALESHITDYTSTLTDFEISSLENYLYEFENTKGSQVVVLVIPTTEPEEIEGYGIRLAEKWKIGRKNVDDGVILLIAKDDRKLRIEVGYALEGAIPDIYAKRIIENVITPEFRQGKFYEGIEAGLVAIVGLIEGEELLAVTTDEEISSDDDVNTIFTLVIAFLLLIFNVAIKSKLIKGGIATVVGIVVWIISGVFLAGVFTVFIALIFLFASGSGIGGGSRYRSGGGFMGGGSSGGGFSGGGGSFGGGGASGSW